MAVKVETPVCPACSSRLSEEGRSAGLCPSCLLELALDDTSLEAELNLGEAPTLQFSPDQSLSEGEIQGDRYRIRSLLGRGGMGEVWRAYDLKLRQDVALKALRKELIRNPEALATLRQEVRVAREVISPNVCRVYDLEELDDQELISMEYVDGTTLQEILRERGPLDLNDAREIASQFLAGLESIHEAGLVHRDIKPENLMVTRTGRVVVMDFGIAKGLDEGKGGLVAGTPAYMSPEHARGGELDARADVFSTGVVLAEMVEPGGMGSFEDRRRVWEGIHREVPQVADTPWSSVIAKTVSGNCEQRFASASALARALEEVTLRAVGGETARPFPGLSAFQEEDADFFYGRELEVEALWKKLRRPHLLAVIGPSGAGKSSFLRAGLLPTLPEGWRAIVATPGSRPFDNLAQALAPKLSDAPGVADLLHRFDEPGIAVELLSEWRQLHHRALVIVDQFEELFTQNLRGVQQQFAELLAALPLKADVHVLLSMRDDFLLHCQTIGALTPVFSEITPLGPPTGASLRRAIVEPALRCGYRFEDESIVEEMLSEVEGQRGALPMVAFAAARVWEERDREKGLLTREAYERIGGVGGALAQHAEAALKEIGKDGIPIARELFRNLVTAQGTRAARDRDELLSVFRDVGAGLRAGPREGTEALPYNKSAEEVLNTLIDARLLTSYEVPAADNHDTPHHRIEIVHESLLSNWPRLVRWQTRDSEGAQLRDELRAQAQLWEQHGHSVDYLWTGAAYLDFLAWRERYPGGLTNQEEVYAAAITAHANRRKRRLRIAASVVLLLSLVVAVLMGSLWLRSEAEARRAQASRLLALAQVRIETDPTESLAYTIASLELDDSEESRMFAMRALWAGPPAMVLDPQRGEGLGFPRFSPDGQWLSLAGVAVEEVPVWHRDGADPIILGGHLASPADPIQTGWVLGNLIATGHRNESRVRLWQFPGGALLREIDLGAPGWWQISKAHLLAEVLETETADNPGILNLRSWHLPDGEREELGSVDFAALGCNGSTFHPNGNGWICRRGGEIIYRPLPVSQSTQDLIIGSHENDVRFAGFPRESDRLWTRDTSTGELWLWNLSAAGEEPLRIVPSPSGIEPGTPVVPSPDGRWLHDAMNMRDGKVLLWNQDLLPAADPLALKRSGVWYFGGIDFSPGGEWLVASTKGMSQLSFWPLRTSMPAVVTGYDSAARRSVLFTNDGKWLVTYWGQDKLRLWPMPGSGMREIRELPIQAAMAHTRLTLGPADEQVFVAGYGGNLLIVPLGGGESTRLEGFSAGSFLEQGAFSPSGRFAAAATSYAEEEHKLRLWNLETGAVRDFKLPQPVRGPAGADNSSKAQSDPLVWSLAFSDESTLLTSGGGGVLRWDLEAGTYQRTVSAQPGQTVNLWLSRDRQQMITAVGDPADACGPLVLHDLASHQSRDLKTVATCQDRQWPRHLAFDDTLSVMAIGRPDGTVLVGHLESESLHLLIGHRGPIADLAISPDRRWIATSGNDNTLRLWPMPDLDKPPLHTLPHDELIAKLKSLTNIRVVQDPDSTDDWEFTLDPFPGWKEAPTWQ